MSGRVALVTGSSRGIGRAICQELARRGISVVVNYRTQEAEGEALAQELSAGGARAIAVRADVTVMEDVRRLVAETKKAFGRLDVLVNNAGVLREGFFATTSVDAFWSVMHTNLGGVVNTTKAALPLLLHTKNARIVNISSIAAMHASAGLSAYAASKAAIVAVSKSLARELGPVGIKVNVVAPGLVETAMAESSERRLEARDAMVAGLPVRRMGRAEEVASVVGYLSDDAPDYLTGEIIRVDGGALIA